MSCGKEKVALRQFRTSSSAGPSPVCRSSVPAPLLRFAVRQRSPPETKTSRGGTQQATLSSRFLQRAVTTLMTASATPSSSEGFRLRDRFFWRRFMRLIRGGLLVGLRLHLDEFLCRQQSSLSISSRSLMQSSVSSRGMRSSFAICRPSPFRNFQDFFR